MPGGQGASAQSSSPQIRRGEAGGLRAFMADLGLCGGEDGRTSSFLEGFGLSRGKFPAFVVGLTI